MRAGHLQDGEGWAQEAFTLTVVRLKRGVSALQPAQGCGGRALAVAACSANTAAGRAALRAAL